MQEEFLGLRSAIYKVASYKRLLLLEVTANTPPQNVGEEIIVATVKDPWGNIIGIINNPEFKN